MKKVKKSHPAKSSTTKTAFRRQARSPDKSEDDSDNNSGDEPQEDPFSAVAVLEDINVDLAANTEVPMEVDEEHLSPAELTSVDLAEKEFAKRVQTLAAEADAVFEQDFGVKCTDAERKDASRIMDIVSFHILFSHYTQPSALPACKACLQGEPLDAPL